MTELAPLKLSAAAETWNDAPIGASVLEGLDILHVKAAPAREMRLVADFALPAPLTSAALGDVEALWMGPGEWLLLAARGHAADVQARLDEGGVAWIDGGSRSRVVRLDGAARLMAGLTGLPDAALAPGRVARTILAGIDVVLTVHSDGAVLIVVEQGYLPHMRAWLDRAASGADTP